MRFLLAFCTGTVLLLISFLHFLWLHVLFSILSRDHLSPSTRFTLTPRRRYPIQQAQYAALGTLPSICWDEYRRKNRLSIHHSSIAHSPVTVKIARPESSIGRSPLWVCFSNCFWAVFRFAGLTAEREWSHFSSWFIVIYVNVVESLAISSYFLVAQLLRTHLG